jgi:guanylate kinase
VQDKIAQGHDVLLEIDVHGGLRVKNVYLEAVLIFLAPPSMDELKRRLTQRGTESAQSIQKRTEIAYKEMEYVSYYDYVVVNSTVEAATEGIGAIVHAEKSRVARSDDLISVLLERRDKI